MIVVSLESCSSSEDILACNPSITQLTNFNIENIPPDSFELKIYHGDTNGEYKKNLPKLFEVSHVMNGSFVFPYGNEWLSKVALDGGFVKEMG